MKRIEKTVSLTPVGALTLELPEDIAPGEHRIILVIEEHPPESAGVGSKDDFEFPVVHMGPWPEGLSLRREDMYDDDGR